MTKTSQQDAAQHTYENVEILKTNGQLESQDKSTANQMNGNSSLEFIQMERESHYDVPRPISVSRNTENASPLANGTSANFSNGSSVNRTEVAADDYKINTSTKENTYETLKTDVEENKDHYVDMHSKVEEVIYTDIDENYENIEETPQTQTQAVRRDYELIEPNLTEEHPRIPNLTLQSPDHLSFTDFSEPEPEHPEIKSVKDRMFLATDDASCLLFTQTVTSPMLTPSEENIDFLKGFQTEAPSQNTSSDNSNSPKSDEEEEKHVESPENLSDNLFVAQDAVDDAPLMENDAYEERKYLHENLYENIDVIKNKMEGLVDHKTSHCDEEVVESVSHNGAAHNEPIYENVNSLKHVESSHIEEIENKEVVDEKHEFVANEHEMTGSTIVQSLKSRFSSLTREEEKVVQREQIEFSGLKTIDIMRHISKFENKEESSSVATNVNVVSVFLNNLYFYFIIFFVGVTALW